MLIKPLHVGIVRLRQMQVVQAFGNWRHYRADWLAEAIKYRSNVNNKQLLTFGINRRVSLKRETSRLFPNTAKQAYENVITTYCGRKKVK